MSATEDDPLGDQVKAYERAVAPTINRDRALFVRLDGKSFTKWTKPFETPFDAYISTAFQEVTQTVMDEFDATAGFTQSDEITLYWPACHGSREHPFGGKTQKLASIMASYVSHHFYSFFDDSHPFPLFDARTFGTPPGFAGDVFRWRHADAVRNGVNSACSARWSHKELMGKKHAERIAMLGDDISLIPPHNRYGSGYVARKVERELDAETLAKIPEQHRPAGPVLRRVIERVEMSALRESL